MEEWKDCDFDCPECGKLAIVKTKAPDGYFYDGDELKCPECGLKGGVIISDGDAWDQWDW